MFERHILLQDINCVYKVYVTYIMLYNFIHHRIHLKSSRTYILPHRNELVLSIYCLASTVKWHHLDPVKGSRWLPTFLVWPDFLEPSAVACHVVMVRLGWYVWKYECLCLCLHFCLHRVAPPFPFFSHLAFPDTFWDSHQILIHDPRRTVFRLWTRDAQ